MNSSKSTPRMQDDCNSSQKSSLLPSSNKSSDATHDRTDAAEGEPTLAAAPVLAGRMLCGKWRIHGLLGTGGTSSVYAATHRNGNRVAIKVLNRELALNGAMRRRFLREGYIANRVGHEGAVSVLDDDASEDGLVFLVMEFVDGEDLEARRQRRGGRLAPAEALPLMKQLLEVLVAAHRNGIVHRDVKPSNVLVTPDGGVKLLDFGIASLRESRGTASQTLGDALLGTPAFMAPEQALGRQSDVDARTDVWAVGATLFRLLSGRLVHERATRQETTIAAATERARSLADACPEAAPELVRWVDRALQRDPNQRFQSASSMLTALRELRLDTLDTARSAHSKTSWLKLAMASLLAALLIAATATLFWRRALPPASIEPPSRPLTSKAGHAPPRLAAASAAAALESAPPPAPITRAVPSNTVPPRSRTPPGPVTSARTDPTAVRKPRAELLNTRRSATPEAPSATPLTSAVTPDLGRILGERR